MSLALLTIALSPVANASMLGGIFSHAAGYAIGGVAAHETERYIDKPKNENRENKQSESRTGNDTNVLHGKVVGIMDGDTIKLLSNNQEYRIRYANIDAPETAHGKKKPAQPFGEKSKQSLSDLVFGKTVSANCPNQDQYGRYVCTVTTSDGLDTNLQQVKRGMAWVYRKYSHEQNYVDAENIAKSAKIGLWQDQSPTPPWEWRRSETEQQ